jgi:hypothetical protein
MRVAIFLVSAVGAVISFAGEQSTPLKLGSTATRPVGHDLSGPWTLRIENPRHRVVTTMTIRFTDEAAGSCIGGNWKRVVVTAHTSSDEKFFPVTEPLSYQMTNDDIAIGRNEICDAYLHLNGRVNGVAASGEYVGFGLGGGKRLGYFSLTKGT